MDKKLAEEKVREMFDSLTSEQLAELQNSFAETMDRIKAESVEKLEALKVEKEKLKAKRQDLKDYFDDYNNTPMGFLSKDERDEVVKKHEGKNDLRDKLRLDEETLILNILNQENVVKVLENNGLISNVTDQDGFEYKEVPDFRKVDSTEFDFDEKNVLIIPTPKYIPFIDEDKFRGHGYVFDAIRLTEDSYMVCLGTYSRKEKETNNFFIATLDQLVLIIDYYYAKAKAKNIERADKSDEDSKQRYFALTEEKRRYYMFQKGLYRYLSANDKKKVSEAEFEAMDLEEREKYYLPISKATVKRIASKLGVGEMYVSFHIMYEDFIDKTKAIINQGGKRYANPTVGKYWRDFAEMINYKLKDIKIQREDYSDTYKQAIETSFGESNVDTILKEKYGILVKRQNGDKINPVEIDLIEKSWIKIQNVYGNLKAEALKNNLKISHSGERLMFAMKALGVFIPQMGTIGVSNKLGEVDFRSTFSHETAHFIDNFIGKLNGKRWATDDYESLAGKIAFTFRNSMNKSKNDQTDYINATKECFARAFQQYFGMKTEGEDAFTKNVDNKVAPEGIEIWKHPNFVNKFTFKDEIEPLIEQFLKENLDVFETTVDIDGTNDLAPITKEETENTEEESIQTLKLKVMKLWTKAFKMMPQSIGQKKVIKEIDEINDKIEKLGGDKVIEKQEPEATTEDVLKIFKDIVLESKSFDEAFDKVSNVQGVPREVSAFFFEKYNPNNKLDKHDTFLKFYTEIKGEQPTEEPEESIPELIEGLKVMLEYSEGEEKKDLEDTIEGLKLLL